MGDSERARKKAEDVEWTRWFSQKVIVPSETPLSKEAAHKRKGNMTKFELVCGDCGWSKPRGRGKPQKKCPKCKGELEVQATPVEEAIEEPKVVQPMVSE